MHFLLSNNCQYINEAIAYMENNKKNIFGKDGFATVTCGDPPKGKDSTKLFLNSAINFSSGSLDKKKYHFGTHL